MTKVFLVIATAIDLGLAALLVAVSGFLFGSGPQSMHAGPLLKAGYLAAVIACVVLPVVGFRLNAKKKPGAGLFAAYLPPLGALLAILIPAPY